MQLQLNQSDGLKSSKQTIQQAQKHPKLSLNKIQQQQLLIQQKAQSEQPIEVNKKQISPEVQESQQQQPVNTVQNSMQQAQVPIQASPQQQFQQQISQIQTQQISPIKQFPKPIQKSNFQPELNRNQPNNQNSIIMNKKIENTMDRNANAFNNQSPINVKSKPKSSFAEREKQLTENMESRREKIINHVPRKGFNKNFNENPENIEDLLSMNKMQLLDDLQEIQNEQDNGDFMVSFLKFSFKFKYLQYINSENRRKWFGECSSGRETKRL